MMGNDGSAPTSRVQKAHASVVCSCWLPGQREYQACVPMEAPSLIRELG